MCVVEGFLNPLPTAGRGFDIDDCAGFLEDKTSLGLVG